VIQIATDDARLGESGATLEMLHETAWVRLPACTPVEREHTAGWEAEFLRMRDAFRDPHPCSRLRVRVGVANILRYVLDQQPDTLGESPAARLKRMITEDTRCEQSLETLSRRCGFSSDHLRKLFAAEYSVTPLAYRNRQRLDRGLRLLANSNLAVKEVARETGFKHTSHFCSLFRTTYGMTPRDAIRRYREKER
jgi:AraC-like DNA-binding protein